MYDSGEPTVSWSVECRRGGEGENGRETGGWQRATLFVLLMSNNYPANPAFGGRFQSCIRNIVQFVMVVIIFYHIKSNCLIPVLSPPPPTAHYGSQHVLHFRPTHLFLRHFVHTPSLPTHFLSLRRVLRKSVSYNPQSTVPTVWAVAMFLLSSWAN